MRFRITIIGIITIACLLFLGGCGRSISPQASATPAIVPTPLHDIKVRWIRPEFLYTDATYLDPTPLVYPINADGTLVPPLTRYRIDDTPLVLAQFETYIDALTTSPDHRSVYLLNSADSTNRLGRYGIGRQGQLNMKQALVGGNKTYFPMSVAFAGRKRFLYVMYNQIMSNSPFPNRYVLAAYRFGVGGRIERLPGPLVVAATYTTAAFVANPGIVPACAVSGPSVQFLTVVRPGDHNLDVYRIRSGGVLSVPPTASLSLGYRPGRAVFLPSRRTLYVADTDHECLIAYRIGPDGMPVLLPNMVSGIDPALDPQGRFLYATARRGRALFCYAVLPDGTLRLRGTTPTHALCYAPCVDATGHFVYALGEDSEQLDEHVISQFRITNNGVLVPLQPEQVPAVGSRTLVAAY